MQTLAVHYWSINERLLTAISANNYNLLLKVRYLQIIDKICAFWLKHAPGVNLFAGIIEDYRLN